MRLPTYPTGAMICRVYCGKILMEESLHHLGCRNLVNNRINYQPQQVSWISSINSITFTTRETHPFCSCCHSTTCFLPGRRQRGGVHSIHSNAGGQWQFQGGEGNWEQGEQWKLSSFWFGWRMKLPSPKLSGIVPENRPKAKRKGSSSKHPFSGAMVLRRVYDMCILLLGKKLRFI